jgi:hypothetical protein
MILSAVGLGLLIVTLSRLLVGGLDGLSPWSAVQWPVIVCWLVGSAVVTSAGGAGLVIVVWSRPVALVVAVALVGTGIGIGSLVDSPVRFPAHARHLDRLGRGILAGSRAPAAPGG